MSKLQGFVPTDNYRRFQDLLKSLQETGDRSPKLGVVEGTWGHGKTTSLDKLEAEFSAHITRVMQNWTFAVALADICEALEVIPKGRSYLNMKLIKEKIENTEGRIILIVDEADQLFKRRDFRDGEKIFQLFRDIHDISNNVIIILMGEIGLKKKIESILGQAYRSRIRDSIRLEPPSVSDFKKQGMNFKVRLDDEIYEYFAKEIKNLRLTQVIHENIEKVAKENDYESLTFKDYISYKKKFEKNARDS